MIKLRAVNVQCPKSLKIKIHKFITLLFPLNRCEIWSHCKRTQIKSRSLKAFIAVCG